MKPHMRNAVSLKDIQSEVRESIRNVQAGTRLDEQTATLIQFAVNVSVTTLDMEAADKLMAAALDAGATGQQIQDVMMLVSGLGVHTLMEGCTRLTRHLEHRAPDQIETSLTPQQESLWARHVGDNPYWLGMEEQAPGFLNALMRLSPEAFEAFFVYCAVPWKSTALPLLTKELISLAADTTPTHRYLPGARLHLANAIRLGTGRVAILETLEIAASAPPHRGVS